MHALQVLFHLITITNKAGIDICLLQTRLNNLLEIHNVRDKVLTSTPEVKTTLNLANYQEENSTG